MKGPLSFSLLGVALTLAPGGAFCPLLRVQSSANKPVRSCSGTSGTGVLLLFTAKEQISTPLSESPFTMGDLSDNSSIPVDEDEKSSAKQRAKAWSNMDPNPVTAKLATMEMFLIPGRLTFGTAGLRGPMGVGPMKMNDLVVIQTAQGLARYYQEQHFVQAVVIGYDHRASERYNISSRQLAMWTALVFRECFATVILLDGYVATPMVPFAQQAMPEHSIGIMVTASHNPKEDAGYKIYGTDACQIRSPADEEIAASIEANLVPWKDYRKLMQERDANNDACCGLSHPELTRKLQDQYFAALQSCALFRATPTNFPDKPKITYTAMNGVGDSFVHRAFELFGLDAPISVPEQQCPDPTFAGTPFPNPEENGALLPAMRFASDQCRIILANDPDADRLAVAERKVDGSWHIFTGDEIGCLLGCELYRRSQTLLDASSKVPVMCASTVSSKFLKAFAHAKGFHFEETAPGFKWIGSTAKRLHGQAVPGSNGRQYEHIFSYEESIGYCCGGVVFDKDGISAAIVVAQLVYELYGKNMTLMDQLQQLYHEYGEFVSFNGYFRVTDMEKIPLLLNRLASVDIVEAFTVTSVNCVRKSETKPPAQVVLNFENGCVAQFRASGTEPKFKYYFELPGKPGVPRHEVAKDLQTMVASILVPLCEPEIFGLTRP